MSDSVIIGVAEGVVHLLDLAKDDRLFATSDWLVERSYADWDLKLENAKDLRIDVVAVTNLVTTELGDRGSVRYTVPVDIGIRQRFPQEDRNPDSGLIDKEAVDPLVLLTEQINDYFVPQTSEEHADHAPGRLPTLESASWIETTIRTSGNRQHLRDWSQFTGIVRVTYDVRKEIFLECSA